MMVVSSNSADNAKNGSPMLSAKPVSGSCDTTVVGVGAAASSRTIVVAVGVAPRVAVGSGVEVELGEGSKVAVGSGDGVEVGEDANIAVNSGDAAEVEV